MITDKERQQYIPKFYLQNFSYQRNMKQIGVSHAMTGYAAG
ncbi:MAG TPA: hypothetical protein VNS58_04085 [Puia sp.]|nr:hypothetical protein [Puia sp.]